MLDFNDMKKVNIKEICNIFHTEENKIYPKGTCYIRISATDGEVRILKEATKLTKGFVVFMPKK